VPGLKVYAGWVLSLPPSTPNTIVEWYQDKFSQAILSAEYREWADQNYIIIDKTELNPKGVIAYAEELRTSFAPVIKKGA
jgi:tripartite-type tricarboxylate transporter receptor subunit TctC